VCLDVCLFSLHRVFILGIKILAYILGILWAISI
jgi:hypothetical protein